VRVSSGKISVEVDVPGSPNGLAIGPDGALYICNSGGFVWDTTPDGFLRTLGKPSNFVGGSIDRYDFKTKKLTTLYTHCDGKRLVGPNDLVFDRDGGLWFSDLGTMAGRVDFCSAYYCRIDDNFITEVAGPFYGGNGIGLSPDDKTLYVAETPTGRLWAFDITGRGTVKKSSGGWASQNGGRVVYTLPSHFRCDSIAVEAGGNICIATLRASGISSVTPDGKLTELILFDDPSVTNICFGGADMKSAYVTLSGKGKIARMDWLRPGHKLAYY
jgi:gluconolactonase